MFQDLQKRADAAGKAGFIYMSFGSVVDPSKMDSETKLAFLEAFRHIKLPIFWKIDITNDPVINEKTVPANVYIQKWYPQSDILSKLFCIASCQVSKYDEASECIVSCSI